MSFEKEWDDPNRPLPVTIGNKVEKVYLSRRNLKALLSKLDRRANGEETACTLIKSDNIHPKYPQTMDEIAVIAVEDNEYYTERPPGLILPADVK